MHNFCVFTPGSICLQLNVNQREGKKMIACYFQCLYCGISPPTQFLQLSPRLEISIVSVSVFICLFASQIVPPPVSIRETNQASDLRVSKRADDRESFWREGEVYQAEFAPRCLGCEQQLLVLTAVPQLLARGSSRSILAAVCGSSPAAFLPFPQVCAHLGSATPSWYQSTMSHAECFFQFTISSRNSTKEC